MRTVIPISSVERRTPFISLLHRSPPRTVCPNFYLLAHANGCSFRPGCEYCYLTSSLWSLREPRVFSNVDRLLARFYRGQEGLLLRPDRPV
jgi:DNA repair photolyase